MSSSLPSSSLPSSSNNVPTLYTELGEWLLMHDIDQVFFGAVAFACFWFGCNQFLDCVKRIEPVLKWLYSWIPSIKQFIVITFLFIFVFTCMWIYLTTSTYSHTFSDYLQIIPKALYALGRIMFPQETSNRTVQPNELTYWAFLKSTFISFIPSSTSKQDL